MERVFRINAERGFKGIWFPKELYLNKELNWTEKILLLEVDSLSKNGECFASNQHFADFLGVSKKRVETIISDLRKRGYLASRITYKGESKEVDKRFLRITDPYRFSTEDPYPQKQGEGVLENEDTPTLENEGDKNTVFINTTEEYNHKEYQERISEEMTQESIQEEETSVWEWESDFQYKTYLSKKLPEFAWNIANRRWDEKADQSLAAKTIIDITKNFFKLYRQNTGERHPWYAEEMIERCLNDLFKHFDNSFNAGQVMELQKEFFKHRGNRDYHMMVFTSQRMLGVLQNIVDGTESEINDLTG